MSTINIVKYYFYKGMMPKDPEKLRYMIAVAYQTARDRQIFPKEVLIRYADFVSLSSLLSYIESVQSEMDAPGIHTLLLLYAELAIQSICESNSCA